MPNPETLLQEKTEMLERDSEIFKEYVSKTLYKYISFEDFYFDKTFCGLATELACSFMHNQN